MSKRSPAQAHVPSAADSDTAATRAGEDAAGGSERSGEGTASTHEGERSGGGSSATRTGAVSSVLNSSLMRSQLVRFILVGGLSAVVDFGFTAFFHWVAHFNDASSKTAGFILGTLTAYLLNRRWTFQAQPSVRRFVVTMLTYALTYVVQVGLYLVTIPWLTDLGLGALWVRVVSFIVAQGTATVLNFLIQKFLIFRR